MAAANHLFMFTPYVDDPSVQYNVGWSIICVTVVNILVNMAFTAYSSYKSLKLQILRLKQKFKAWMIRRKAAYKEPMDEGH